MTNVAHWYGLFCSLIWPFSSFPFQADDPIVPKLYESTEEGKKVTRNEGDKFLAVFSRIADPYCANHASWWRHRTNWWRHDHHLQPYRHVTPSSVRIVFCLRGLSRSPMDIGYSDCRSCPNMADANCCTVLKPVYFWRSVDLNHALHDSLVFIYHTLNYISMASGGFNNKHCGLK